ncbi:MAG TPA: DUF5946 family protein [Bacteroidia bacterium]|nr:DUF5946 family protein [Bacteroidia bacterium]
MTDLEKYHELSFYTLGLRDAEFIHQHIVDAFAAQSADEKTRNITLFFSLAGLYLFLEKNYTGKQVQKAHQLMAGRTKEFIKINLPVERGILTVKDVLDTPAGVERNNMIRRWCESVWAAYSPEHHKVIEMTQRLLSRQ